MAKQKSSVTNAFEIAIKCNVAFDFYIITGSHRFNFGCIYIVSCQFDAMSNNNEFSVIFAEGAKLGPNDNWFATLGKMASHLKIFGMFFDVDRSCETNSIEASDHHGLEQQWKRRSEVS